ncbi:FeoA family protein [Methanosalsum natronophilum]|uniref:Ferrous iron transport protein A n=1 Tax=Methanosalsum natronophilum TaxID=768733 RepID=A0A424Z2G9_9EURY|nr:FeoA family protein [Methanosalsum natronophilum]MCS3924604.1 ferrous iron transport protein A [Methanosalsum natronophilum]RQD88208.1 MAG: ferrous iron transport protein A [Methanosalsum natronophilum]
MDLANYRKGKPCIIEHMPKNNLLNSMGIREGSRVSIKSRQLFGGPLVIQYGSRCLAIDKKIAEKIKIKEV